MTALILDFEQRCPTTLFTCLRKRGVRFSVARMPEQASQVVRRSSPDLLVVCPGGGDADATYGSAALVCEQHQRAVVLCVLPPGAERAVPVGLRVTACIRAPFAVRDVDACVTSLLDRATLLREVHRLEQELAAHRHMPALQVLSVLPVVCVSRDGTVLYASTRGRAVLHALTSPAMPRPVRRLDPQTISAVLEAVVIEGLPGWTSLEPQAATTPPVNVCVELLDRGGEDVFILQFALPGGVADQAALSRLERVAE